jgi:hypothetical protein
MLWTEYRYRDVVSNRLLFLTSYMVRFVCVILTGLVFAFWWMLTQNTPRFPEFVSKFMFRVSRGREDAGSWQNQGYGPSSKLEIGL